LQLIKNRQGKSEKAIPMNFFGEIGYWKQFPKVDAIKNFEKYLSLNSIEEDELVSEEIEEPKESLTFSF
jgi:hypothetical protein